ncbi:unnamed protein product [Echinostoma caproni]|uniref:Uncharacterized protein n=1 Tax=Echinostoma caproni TaxID=27848 RepID=A0A183AIE2_9TREM|nr:unnamed protein product [Echinostoma caproni]
MSPTGQGPGVVRGSGVVLKRPDRTPSTSSTPPGSGNTHEGLGSTTTSPLNAVPFSPGRDAAPPKRVSTPELTSGPRSTYAPLTDIHNCYRALQQSVNYLIQSQTGLLPNPGYPGYEEDNTEFGFTGTTVASEYENLPLRVGQPPANAVPQVTDFRLPCSSSAAVWPTDLIHTSATGVRRSLSRRNRVDRKRQSTASLDSALQRWDDSQTETPQLKQRSFRGPKSSTVAYSTQKTFPFKSCADAPDTLRLSSTLDRNIVASGDSGLQSYSASLSQSDRKSHPAIPIEQIAQLAHNYRTQSFRTGSASVPEPASPTGSGSCHSATNGWCATRRPQLLPEPIRLVHPGSGDATANIDSDARGGVPVRAMNPLNRTYDFSAQNGPQIL